MPESGGKRYALYCRVTLGKVHHATGSLQGERRAPPGHDSVVANAGAANRGNQHHCEFIVYDFASTRGRDWVAGWMLERGFPEAARRMWAEEVDEEALLLFDADILLHHLARGGSTSGGTQFGIAYNCN